MTATLRINVLAIVAIILCCAAVARADHVIVETTMTMDCTATADDHMAECVMKEDGIPVAECLVWEGEVSCVDIYGEGK